MCLWLVHELRESRRGKDIWDGEKRGSNRSGKLSSDG